MRILKIRVQNINSLKGNWEVDFEDPAYSAGGLFASAAPRARASLRFWTPFASPCTDRRRAWVPCRRARTKR